ncbi:hypothetical protein ACFYO2_27905 [Streptomyces sp. NPDC006602]|uniref:hypothetical protein n=1 Tax=Streptomyces sp. NPDC006602 TaxID=3364751 RepID=UPI0036C1260D
MSSNSVSTTCSRQVDRSESLESYALSSVRSFFSRTKRASGRPTYVAVLYAQYSCHSRFCDLPSLSRVEVSRTCPASQAESVHKVPSESVTFTERVWDGSALEVRSPSRPR